MKKFLKRLGVGIFPILLLMAIAEFMLRQIPNDYQLKDRRYSSHASDFEALILGNSHAFYDLNPVYFKENTFNGGNVSQSIDLDAAIFFKNAKKFSKLRYLIIPISDMSFFFKLSDLAEWRLKNYAIYYDIHVSWNPEENSEVLSLPFSINRHRLISYYLQHESAVTSSYLGYGCNFKSGHTSDLSATALKTIRLHKMGSAKYFEIEKEALQKMISYCRDKEIKVILFIPPAYSGYSSHIDPGRLLATQNTCYDFARTYKNVFFFNLLKDSSFTESDYFDADHLNEIGAKKLSFMIDSILNNPDGELPLPIRH